MNLPLSPDQQGTSTRPYLIRALHDWCTDNGFTPYLAVFVDETVQVPLEYVKDSEIVLNVGFEATSALELGNEFVTFKARFGGVARDLCVPVDHVVAIYARETGQGMAFPMPAGMAAVADGAADQVLAPSLSTEPGAGMPRPGPRLSAVPTGAAHSDKIKNAASIVVDSDDTPPDGGGKPFLKRIK